MSVDKLISDLANIRRQLRELEYEEEYLREVLFDVMNEENVNTIRTRTHQATRRFQSRMMMHKKDVPRAVWNRYSALTEYEVLTIKPR